MKNEPILWMIVPCYNDEEVLPLSTVDFLKKLNELMDAHKISKDSKILLLDDGSKDRTWELIEEFAKKDEHFIGMRQSRNRGHQNTVLAGLMEAKEHCDITISVDSDGQDDLNAMNEMVDAYLDGCEIVYGVRNNRDTDTWFKRNSAQGFYKLMSKMGVETVYNHADYRLVSARVLEHFADFKEVNIYLRGMFPLVGFKSTSVYYARKERMAGHSHYTLSKLLALAMNGITSFSVEPIHLILRMGILIFFMGILGIIWACVRTLTGHGVTGWGSTMCVLLFLGGSIMLSLGVIGEYVGKTYLETKHRPRYIISEKTWEEEK